MSKRLIRELFFRSYLGVSNVEDEKKLFDSFETQNMLLKHWGRSSDLKEKGEFFNKAGIFQVIEWQMQNRKKTSKIKRFTQFATHYAALLVVAILLISGVIYFEFLKPITKISVGMVEITTPRGKQTQVFLPDGTKVFLNSESVLKYPKYFSKRKRTVELVGEGYFEVAHDDNKPFIVKTLDLDIEVMGTTFNVMAYANDKTVETTVVEGKVKVSKVSNATKKNQKVILTPGHKVTYLKESDHLVLDQVNVHLSTSWKESLLLFENESFESVINKLNRWYDTEIILSDDIKGKHRFTMSVDNESLDEVLIMLKKATPIAYTKANGKVVFYATK